MREQVREVFNQLADEDLVESGRRRRVHRPERGRTRTVVLASVILGLLIAPFGIAATGDVLREGVRNGTTAKETEIIGKFNASTGAKGGYVTRQSNTQTGAKAGGGAIYGCRGAAGGTAAGSAPCLRASNLSNGFAFEFGSKSGPTGLFAVGSASDPPFATNGGGRVANLNADKVDGLDAEQLRGQRGPAGPAGPQGEKGPTGEQGPQGPGAAAFAFRSATDTAVTRVLSFHGLLIDARCVSGQLSLLARTAQDDAVIAGAFTDNFGDGNPIRDGNFDTGNTEDLVLPTDSEGGGSFSYQSASGKVVTVTYGFHEAAGPATNECWATGTAVPGS